MKYEVQRVNEATEKGRVLRHRKAAKRTPLWFSPKTNKVFKVSNHGTDEVATGTLAQIKKAAGI